MDDFLSQLDDAKKQMDKDRIEMTSLIRSLGFYRNSGFEDFSKKISSDERGTLLLMWGQKTGFYLASQGENGFFVQRAIDSYEVFEDFLEVKEQESAAFNMNLFTRMGLSPFDKARNYGKDSFD